MNRLLHILICCAICAGLYATVHDPAKARHYSLAAMQSEVQGQLDDAYALYRHAYELDPTPGWPSYRYAIITLVYGHDVEHRSQAMDLLRQYVDAFPADYDEAITYAGLCNIDGNYKESFRVLEKLYAAFPQETDLPAKLWELAMHMEQPDTALHYITLSEQLEGVSPFTTNCKSMTYMMMADTIEAVATIDKALATYPDEPLYWLLKAAASAELEGPQMGLHYLMQADSIFPYNWNIKRSLADYYDQQGDSLKHQEYIYASMLCEDADIDDKVHLFTAYANTQLMSGNKTHLPETLLNTLCDQYPYESEIRALASDYYSAEGDYSMAADQMAIALDMDPDNDLYRAKQVQHLMGANRNAEAVECYEHIEDPEVLNNPANKLLGAYVYQANKEYDKALAQVDALIYGDTNGRDPLTISVDSLINHSDIITLHELSEALAEKGNILFEQGETAESFKYYEVAIAMPEPSVLILNNYAYFTAEKGIDLPRALEMSLKVITEEPDNPVYLDTYAYILFRLGKYDEAATYAEQVLKLLGEQEIPENSEYFEHYGDILSKMGDTDKALQMWQKALSLQPDSEILKRKINSKSYIDETH